MEYPVTVLGTEYFKAIDLDRYDVLIVPPGNYKMFDEDQLEKIQGWVSAGGRLIITAQALNSFADKKGFSLQKYAEGESKENSNPDLKNPSEHLVRYDEAERKSLSDAIFGAIYKVTLDPSHPLSFGLDNSYYSLRTTHTTLYLFERRLERWHFERQCKTANRFRWIQGKSETSEYACLWSRGQGEGEYYLPGG